MTKFDPYSRRELRRRRAAWLRARPKMLALQVAVLVGLLVVVTTCIWVLPLGAGGWYLIGVFHAVLVCAWLHVLHESHLAFDSDAIRHVRGATGEELTRDELLSAKRRRLIWGWVDSIGLAVGDLDHLVVTRRGGIVAIDSKWRNAIVDQDVETMARAARRAQVRADGVLRTVLTQEKGAHRARVRPVAVTPLVVVWGAAQADLPPTAERDGIQFVAGRELRSWLRRLDGEVVDKRAAADLLGRMRSFRARSSQPSRREVTAGRATSR
ncbi:nuclease-related domain-containing protein [Nocardioides sp. CPCC 205120]|uniref:nuclease-related domain-containing protein n=1 Tax=Nocardioides sp. CPCC 205120 TaxID=3406462 RepID=UPI003B501906